MLIDLFITSCAIFSGFYAANVILLQIKVNARNIKKITLARYFIKVLIQGGSLSFRMIVSNGIKFSRMLVIVSLKTDTCLYTSRLKRAFF